MPSACDSRSDVAVSYTGTLRYTSFEPPPLFSKKFGTPAYVEDVYVRDLFIRISVAMGTCGHDSTIPLEGEEVAKKTEER